MLGPFPHFPLFSFTSLAVLISYFHAPENRLRSKLLMLILSYTETGSHVTYINGQLLSARFQRGATFIGANFSLGHQMHIYGIGLANA